jgi:ribosomal protein S13
MVIRRTAVIGHFRTIRHKRTLTIKTNENGRRIDRNHNQQTS